MKKFSFIWKTVTSWKFTSGFTLVELLVTISIFGVLTSVVVFRHADFNKTILLSNVAYDIALTIREAQSYGINVRGVQGGTGDNSFDVGYGIYISDKTDSFIVFADRLTDDVGRRRLYDRAESGECEDSLECVEEYALKNGYFIKDIIVKKGSTVISTNIHALHIVFIRPNPNAYIAITKSVNPLDIEQGFDEARIVLSSTSGGERVVVVTQTGQIAIEENVSQN